MNKTVSMKCDNTECAESWETVSVEVVPDRMFRIVEANCPRCGNSGFINEP